LELRDRPLYYGEEHVEVSGKNLTVQLSDARECVCVGSMFAAGFAMLTTAAKN
jgi:hypothetical protein